MEFLHTNNGVLYCGKNPIILRGMGLGGWLLPEGYMWKFYTKCDRPRRMEKLLRELCGERYAEAFWERYYDRYITERDIAWIAGQGLNSVRLAMNARHLFDIGEQDTVRFHTAYLRHVDDCLAWCKKYGIWNTSICWRCLHAAIMTASLWTLQLWPYRFFLLKRTGGAPLRIPAFWFRR